MRWLAAGLAMMVATPAAADGWWLDPVARAAIELAAVHDTARPYSTPARPRDVAGAVALSCEDRMGQPCGHGVGGDGELDAAGGYGAWLAAAVGLRLRTGTGGYTTGVDVARAHVDAALGPIAVVVGRDVLALGPAVHTRFGWGDNAPPLDHIRIGGERPWRIAPWLGVNARYVLGRLADPQTYPGDVVSIVRGELTLGDRVELGGMQLLQLGGRGAPGFGPIDFILEHVRRRDASASTSDSSNRRIGADVAIRLEADVRVVYQLMFEDLRHEMISAIRYDADQLIGVATPWASLELRRTGERSYEHVPRVTGFTTGGYIVGDPLGPAATAVFASGTVPVAGAAITPWTELARLDSDSFAFGDGPVVRTASGPSELRFRLGVQARIPLTPELSLLPQAAVEDVEREAFIPGARRVNALVRAQLVWQPRER